MIKGVGCFGIIILEVVRIVGNVEVLMMGEVEEGDGYVIEGYIV